MKSLTAKALNHLPAILLGALLWACSLTSASGQVLKKPPIEKAPPRVLKLADLAITDLFEGDTPDSVFVQVGNLGQGDSGSFTIRLALKKAGESQKTYVEKRVFGLKAKTDLPLNIKIGQPLKGLEVGVFLDAKKEIPESNETNCGKLFPNGGAAGFLPCEGF
jgi:hypothetical protein